jgi:hypothetical protein
MNILLKVCDRCLLTGKKLSTSFGRTTFDNTAYHYAVTLIANCCALKTISDVVNAVVVVVVVYATLKV